MASLDELEDVFAIDSPQNVSSFFSYLPSEGSSNKGASNAAIQFHYDVGNPFYKIWLDEQLVYSAARWTDPITSEVLATTLEQAQQEKILFHLRAVKAKPEDSILDIGCGWGAILQSAVSNFGVRKATGLTLSKEQAIMISENCSGREARNECARTHRHLPNVFQNRFKKSQKGWPPFATDNLLEPN